MPVSTFTQPDYTNQLGTSYPTNIDGAIAVLAEMGRDFAPNAATTPNLTVKIAAGKIIKADGTLVSQAEQTATFVAPVTNPRIDRIVVDMLTGVYSIIAGTEAASPTAPAITAGKLPCAQVSLTVAITQITNALLTDERTAFANYDNRYLPSQAPEYAAASGTDTYTATLSPVPSAYVTGGEYHITFTNANATTTPTLNLNSLGAITIVKEGAAALVAGDIPAGHAAILRKTATQFVLINPYYTSGISNLVPSGTWTPSLGGTATYTNQTGSYVRIGKVVYVRFYIGVNVIGTGSATTISGLPFTSANDHQSVLNLAVSTSAVAVVSIYGMINGAGSQVIAEGRTAASVSPAIISAFGSGSVITGAGFYFV